MYRHVFFRGSAVGFLVTYLTRSNPAERLDRETLNRISSGAGRGGLGSDWPSPFFQALTPFQEMTLTFVPKIARNLRKRLRISIPFIFSTLVGLSDRVFALWPTRGGF